MSENDTNDKRNHSFLTKATGRIKGMGQKIGNDFSIKTMIFKSRVYKNIFLTILPSEGYGSLQKHFM